MGNPRKSLLVRADFILDRSRGGSALVFKRWRRVLAEALPRLMGLGNRCSRAVVRLHRGEEQGGFPPGFASPVPTPGADGFRRSDRNSTTNWRSVLLAIGGEVIRSRRPPLSAQTVLCLEHPETILRLSRSEDVGREAPRVEPSRSSLRLRTAVR
jgi:hypothetical protein